MRKAHKGDAEKDQRSHDSKDLNFRLKFPAPGGNARPQLRNGAIHFRAILLFHLFANFCESHRPGNKGGNRVSRAYMPRNWFRPGKRGWKMLREGGRGTMSDLTRFLCGYCAQGLGGFGGFVRAFGSVVIFYFRDV